MRYLPFAMGSLTTIAIALAAVLLFALTTSEASHAGGMDAMSIDMNTTGNTATVLGAREPCARIDENNIQDGDETGVDTITIDVTALNIPASNPMIAFSYVFGFPDTSVLVATENQAMLLASLAGSALFDGLSDPVPDSVTPWNSTGTDGGANPATSEIGSGVLNRLEIQTFPASVAGVFPLTLTDNAHVDTNGTGRSPDVTNNAQVAVNQPCPAPTPSPTPCGTACTPTPTPPPTPTPTPTPPPFKQGDVDCSNAVNSVDALKVLRFVAGLGVVQTEPCDDINTGGPPLQGDVDCGGTVNSVDSLKILRFVAGLGVIQTEPCDDINT